MGVVGDGRIERWALDRSRSLAEPPRPALPARTRPAPRGYEGRGRGDRPAAAGCGAAALLRG